MEFDFLDKRVLVKIGDITDETTDAIVNAANSSLLGGGGVDGAIHRKGGRQILEECEQIRKTEFPDGLPAGRAVITTGGNLKCRFVIHTVGPIYGQNGGRDEAILVDAYKNSLRLAAGKSLKSIAFPSISTGAYSFPKKDAARISSRVIREFLGVGSSIEKVHLVFFSQNDAAIFVKHQDF